MSARATASVYNFNDNEDLSLDASTMESTSTPSAPNGIALLQGVNAKELVSNDSNDLNDFISTVPPLEAAFLDQQTSSDVKLGRIPSDSSIDRSASSMVGRGANDSNSRPESYSGVGTERNINKANDNLVSRGAKSYINTRSGVSLDRLDEGDYYDGATNDMNFSNSLNSNMARDNYGRGYRSNSNGSNNYSVDTELYRMGIAEDRPRNDSVYSIDQESINNRDREFEKEARQKAAQKNSLSPRPTTSTSRPNAHGGNEDLILHHLLMPVKVRNDSI